MDLSKHAGVRISAPREEDNGYTMFEMFVKSTGEVISRGTSYTDFTFIIRGVDRRRNKRIVENERRAVQHGTVVYDYLRVDHEDRRAAK